jgi:hypothetical protein
MTVRKHKLNKELSRQVYETCSNNILPKHCYNNVWEVFEEYTECFREGDWKVAYGYVHATRNMMARHCFIVNSKGEAIDPTLYTLSFFDENKEPEYDHVSFTLLDFDEYLTVLAKNDNQPSLFFAFRTREENAHKWAMNNGMVFMG